MYHGMDAASLECDLARKVPFDLQTTHQLPTHSPIFAEPLKGWIEERASEAGLAYRSALQRKQSMQQQEGR